MCFEVYIVLKKQLNIYYSSILGHNIYYEGGTLSV